MNDRLYNGPNKALYYALIGNENILFNFDPLNPEFLADIASEH